MTDIIKPNPGKERTQSEGSDNEFDPQFKPIITLPEVEVFTNEENENELLKIRAKLYRYDSLSDPPEWKASFFSLSILMQLKERGTGELKILRHKENNSVRIVMRRDKTLKVCANHFITPWMELKPSVGSEKAFVYTVLADFADEKPKTECLAMPIYSKQNLRKRRRLWQQNANYITVREKRTKTIPHRTITRIPMEGKGSVKSDERDADETEVTKKISELQVTKEEEK
ncbi:hypothetical protein NQ318_016531 [Aromia moschata]|uniref:Ran-specific GTPase-activating protein n=1 Tax=Aromia moschata TaxID=1265417 RepID=A0AAV8YYU9_9CUCU|nr:hypothetical protein NQ318_016531 [Aromia moschata]